MRAFVLLTLLGSVCGCSSTFVDGSATSSGGQTGSGGATSSGGQTGSGGQTESGGATSSGGQTGSGGSGTGGTDEGGTGGRSHTDLRTCAANTDCVVIPETCCGNCGVAARGDAIALRQEHVADYRQAACEDSPPCLPCADDPDPTLVATCADGLCKIVDLLEHEVTFCEDADDCRIRAQACCECGADTGPGSLIALRPDAESAYQDLVCLQNSACPGCVPVYPPERVAVCSNAGRCQLE